MHQENLFFIVLIDCEIFSDGFVVNDNEVDEGGSGEDDDDDEEVVQKKKKRRRHLSGKLIVFSRHPFPMPPERHVPLPLHYSCSYLIVLKHNPTFFFLISLFYFSPLKSCKI